MGSSVTRRRLVVQDEGSDLPLRSKINLVGSGVTGSDDPTNDRTIFTIPGATGGSGNTYNFAANSGLPVFNVRDASFAGGATGNGTSDDTLAIQAAIDAAQNRDTPGIVFFPAGVYKITARLEISQPVTLLGVGRVVSSDVYLQGGGSVILNTQSSVGAIRIAYTDQRASNIKLMLGAKIVGLSIGTSVAYNTAAPICTGTAIECGAFASNTIIEDCSIASHDTGINLASGTTSTAYNEVRNCFLWNCKTNGIISSSGATTVEHRISGTRIETPWGTSGWTASDNMSLGTGVELYGDGHNITDTVVIGYQYGFYCHPVGIQGHVAYTGCWADVCRYPFTILPNQRAVNCFATACLLINSFQVSPGAAFTLPGYGGQLVGCQATRGTNGVLMSVGGGQLSGCMITTSDGGAALKFSSGATGTTILSGNYFYAATGYAADWAAASGLRGVCTGNVFEDATVSGGGLVSGSRPTAMVCRGNIGVTDGG